jgi:hypothetical protein
MPDHRDYYRETVDRLEPDIAMIDAGAGHASSSISLKRVADAMDGLTGSLERVQAALAAMNQSLAAITKAYTNAQPAPPPDRIPLMTLVPTKDTTE